MGDIAQYPFIGVRRRVIMHRREQKSKSFHCAFCSSFNPTIKATATPLGPESFKRKSKRKVEQKENDIHNLSKALHYAEASANHANNHGPDLGQLCSHFQLKEFDFHFRHSAFLVIL